MIEMKKLFATAMLTSLVALAGCPGKDKDKAATQPDPAGKVVEDKQPATPAPTETKPDEAKPDEANADEAKPDEAKADEAKPDEAKPADPAAAPEPAAAK